MLAELRLIKNKKLKIMAVLPEELISGKALDVLIQKTLRKAKIISII